MCTQLPVYVGLADYWRTMSCRVTENLSVQNYRFNGPGVRSSAVRRRSSLATILIRLFCENNINLSDTEQSKDKDKAKTKKKTKTQFQSGSIVKTTSIFQTFEAIWLSDFSVTGSPTPAGDILISRYSHCLKIAKFISMIVF